MNSSSGCKLIKEISPFSQNMIYKKKVEDLNKTYEHIFQKLDITSKN